MTSNDRPLTAGDVATSTAVDGNNAEVPASATAPAGGRDLSEDATGSPDVQGYGDVGKVVSDTATAAATGAVLGGLTAGVPGALIGAATGVAVATTVNNVTNAYNAGYAAGNGRNGK